MLKAALFDFDGTLVESDRANLEAINYVLRAHGCRVTNTQYQRKFVGRTNLDVFATVFPSKALAEIQRLAKQKEAVYAHMAKLMTPRKGAADVLRELKRMAIRLGIVTNAPRDVVLGTAERLGIFGYFDVIVTIDDVEHGKPHPGPYLFALSKLGLTADEALAIEDSSIGQRSAKAAGLRTLMVKNDNGQSDIKVSSAAVRSIESLYCVPAFLSNHQKAQDKLSK